MYNIQLLTIFEPCLCIRLIHFDHLHKRVLQDIIDRFDWINQEIDYEL